MKARIKKGVRPYGGRIFPVIERKTYPNGRRVVVVDIAVHFAGILRALSGRADEWEYDEDEVEMLEEKENNLHPGLDNYVAWLRYVKSGDRTRIVVCDSDEPGAFKVYRKEEEERDV